MFGTFLPKKVFFTSGCGTSKEPLTAFEFALRDAKIECYNLVHVSSILPPKCEIIGRDEGLKYLNPGSIVFTVMSRLEHNEPYRNLSASIGLAIPENTDTEWGYLSEHHAFGQNKETAGRYAEMLARNMYESISGKKAKRGMNFTRSQQVDKNGNWTCVIAAAVFVMEDFVDISSQSRIGPNKILRSNTIVYSRCKIGNNFQTGHNVIIREGCDIGNDVTIGSYSILDGAVKIGNNVKIQSRCTITDGSTIGNNVFIGPHTVFLNDKYPPSNHLSGPCIEDDVVIGGGSIILPEVTIHKGAFVAAGSLVTKDVPPEKMAMGSPAAIFDIPEKYIKGRRGI